MHLGAAQFFGRHPLADGRLHQRRPGQEQARALRHQHVIAHHRQIGASGHAHPHDRRDLRNAHRAHHRVVAKHAAKIVGVRETRLLAAAETRPPNPPDKSSGCDSRWRCSARESLSSPSSGKNAPAFTVASLAMIITSRPATRAEAGHRAGRRRAAPFLVHLVSGVEAQLEERASADRSAARSRSRAVSRPFLCCASMPRAPPPSCSLASSFLISREQVDHAARSSSQSRGSRDWMRVSRTGLAKDANLNLFCPAPSVPGRLGLARWRLRNGRKHGQCILFTGLLPHAAALVARRAHECARTPQSPAWKCPAERSPRSLSSSGREYPLQE